MKIIVGNTDKACGTKHGTEKMIIKRAVIVIIITALAIRRIGHILL